jgi:hypothetical protein
MKKDVKYLEKALIVVLDDDEHGRLGLSWEQVCKIRSVVAPGDPTIRCSFYTLQTLCERGSRKGKEFYVGQP